MDPKRAKILLIEDDRIICDMYRIKFRISGLDLAIARGGHEGLDQAKKVKPDLVFLDVKMEDLDGFEVLKRLKADPGLSRVPVIMLTNMSESKSAEEAIKLGADAYVVKSLKLPQDIVNLAVERLRRL